MTPALEQPSSLFQNDSECFDAYAKICGDMWKRFMLSRHVLKSSFSSEKYAGEVLIRHQIARLTKVISFEEWLFWEKAARSRAAGIELTIDLLSDHYGLEHFEKRVFLFLLCFESIKVDDAGPGTRAVWAALDLENSMTVRFKNYVNWGSESVLFKYDLLKREDFWGLNQVAVHPKILEFAAQRLMGEKPELPKKPFMEPRKSGGKHAEAINPSRKFDQVILDSETKEKIRFFLEIYQSRKFKELRIDKNIRNSGGLVFLFFGPPGTGKTMLAEGIAEKLEKKLIIAETSNIFAAYFGETDQNIKKIFEQAKEEDAVLLLDEADALAADRQISSGDFKARFVNLLLTELERFEGIAVLTTNLREILDKALERRIALKVEFKLPGPEQREAIWRGHVPENFTVEADVRFNYLAGNYEFSGGNIKNAVLNAIRRVLFRNETRLTMEDFIFGAELEMEGSLLLKARRRIGF